MALLEKNTGSKPAGPDALPEVLLIVANGLSTDIFIPSGYSLGEIIAVCQAATQVFVEQGYLCSTTIELPPGSNPLKLLICRVTVLDDPRNPFLSPLVRLLNPKYKAMATLGVHNGKLLHYKLTLPPGQRIDSRRALKLGPTGVEVRHPGNIMEFWGTKAKTYAEIRTEAQRIADIARCLVIGHIYEY